MSRDAPLRSLQERVATLLIPIFFLALWLPTLETLVHFDHSQPLNEKRMLAKYPKFKGIGEIKPFLADLESYFNDHFGYRRRLVWNGIHLNLRLFGEVPGSKVMPGRNGWLFYWGDGTYQHLTRQIRFSEKELCDWQRLLETRRDWLAARGIKYLFVIPPDKHTVYPEYLPAWVPESKMPSKVDQLLDHMKAHSTVQVLSLRDPLLEAKRLESTYLATDTHWNSYGSFIGYKQLVERLTSQGSDLKPVPLEAFERKRSIAAGGDLAVMLGAEQTLPETQRVDFVPHPHLGTFKLENDISRLIKQKPGEFDGLITTNENASGKLLLFRDSFSSAWVQFLGYNFREVVYIYRHDWDMETVKREQPDIVIDEIVERIFDSINPNDLREADNLE